jgi:hypothetical protein
MRCWLRCLPAYDRAAFTDSLAVLLLQVACVARQQLAQALRSGRFCHDRQVRAREQALSLSRQPPFVSRQRCPCAGGQRYEPTARPCRSLSSAFCICGTVDVEIEDARVSRSRRVTGSRGGFTSTDFPRELAPVPTQSGAHARSRVAMRDPGLRKPRRAGMGHYPEFGAVQDDR